MKQITFICNKLARDKTAEQMHQDGMSTHHTFLNKTQIIPALNNKLLEEALEVTQATNRTEVVAELADVLEVIDAIRHAYAITHEELAMTKQAKHRTRGGFNRGLFLRSISMACTHHRVNHFRKNPDRYPEQ